jgi:hypothetical protein
MPFGRPLSRGASKRDEPHRIEAVGLSPTALYVASAGTDGVVLVHDMRALAAGPVLALEHDFVARAVADNELRTAPALEWSLCSRFLVTAADDATVRLWDVSAPFDNSAVMLRTALLTHRTDRTVPVPLLC